MISPKVNIGDIVICDPTGAKETLMLEIVTASWHTGYSQWHFNKDEDLEFYERQILYRWIAKKQKWVRY